MRTQVAETSVAAYREHRRSGKLSAQEQALIRFLAKHSHVPLTRNEIAQLSGMRLSAVCGRIHALARVGIVEELERRPDRFTRIQAHPVRLADPQGCLFEEAA